MGIANYGDESIHDQKSIFLPMFCRLSIKDVKLNTAPISAAAEPSSPRVSCMGQVKRNNRVTGYPSAAAIIAAAGAHPHKHSKPRKIQYFSTKTLLPNPATAAASGGRKSGSRSCRSNREICTKDSRRAAAKTNCDHDCGKVAALDISKMDPPLPVVRRAAPPGNSVNIWKRRFDGVKSMQIEPIHLPTKKFQPPPTTV